MLDRKTAIISLVLLVLLAVLASTVKAEGYGSGFKRGPSRGVVSNEFEEGSFFASTILSEYGTHRLHGYTEDWDRADQVFILGTTLDFAWFRMSEDQPDTIRWLQDSGNRYRSMIYNPGNKTSGSGLPFDGQLRMGDAASQSTTKEYVGFWVDWLSVIPEGATILEAYLMVTPYTNTYMAGTDSLVVVTMNRPGDDKWYTSIGLDFRPGTADAALQLSHASWNHQIFKTDNATAQGWGVPSGSPSDAWSPAIGDRSYPWDWQVAPWPMDFSPNSRPDAAGSYVASGDSIKINIANGVQYVVNGGTNNGHLLWGMDKTAGAGNEQWKFHGFNIRPGHSAEDGVPYFFVRWTTEPQAPKFPGGRDIAFVFTTDDQVADANDAFAEEYAARGYSYSIMCVEDNMAGAPANNRGAGEDFLRWYNQGMEIAIHSRWHESTNGLHTYYHPSGADMALSEYTRGMDPATFVSATAGDSLYADTDPVWLYDEMESASGIPAAVWEADQRVGKTLATPLNKYDHYVIEAAKYHGYRAIRIGQVGVSAALDRDHRLFREVGETSYADSAYAGMAFNIENPSHPFNALLHPTNYSTSQISGLTITPGVTPMTESEFKTAFGYIVHSHRANGNRLISVYTHGLRDGSYSFTGWSRDEVRWALDVCDSLGVAPMNLKEYAEWERTYADAIDYPWTATEKPAEFHETAADEVWYERPADSHLLRRLWGRLK